MSRSIFVCAAVALLLVSCVLTAEARSLKDIPGLDIKVGDIVSVTGGNGTPLQVIAPGTNTVVGTQKTPCGDKTLVGVTAPGTTAAVDSGSGCEKAKVGVTAPGTTVAASG